MSAYYALHYKQVFVMMLISVPCTMTFKLLNNELYCYIDIFYLVGNALHNLFIINCKIRSVRLLTRMISGRANVAPIGQLDLSYCSIFP